MVFWDGDSRGQGTLGPRFLEPPDNQDHPCLFSPVADANCVLFAGQNITFKTTLKGVNKLADSAFGDLWMPFSSLIVMCISLGFGISKLASGPSVITTLAISVVWIVYGIIPPYLLAHYSLIGRGTTLQFMCRYALPLPSLCNAPNL